MAMSAVIDLPPATLPPLLSYIILDLIGILLSLILIFIMFRTTRKMTMVHLAMALALHNLTDLILLATFPAGSSNVAGSVACQVQAHARVFTISNLGFWQA